MFSTMAVFWSTVSGEEGISGDEGMTGDAAPARGDDIIMEESIETSFKVGDETSLPVAEVPSRNCSVSAITPSFWRTEVAGLGWKVEGKQSSVGRVLNCCGK